MAALATERVDQASPLGDALRSGVMVAPLRHRQTKEAETDMFDLQPPRHISTLHEAPPAIGQSNVRSARILQTSTCSAIASASSTSIPRYRTVLSIFLWPSKSWTARRLPVRR